MSPVESMKTDPAGLAAITWLAAITFTPIPSGFAPPTISIRSLARRKPPVSNGVPCCVTVMPPMDACPPATNRMTEGAVDHVNDSPTRTSFANVCVAFPPASRFPMITRSSTARSSTRPPELFEPRPGVDTPPAVVIRMLVSSSSLPAAPPSNNTLFAAATAVSMLNCSPATICSVESFPAQMVPFDPIVPPATTAPLIRTSREPRIYTEVPAPVLTTLDVGSTYRLSPFALTPARSPPPTATPPNNVMSPAILAAPSQYNHRSDCNARSPPAPSTLMLPRTIKSPLMDNCSPLFSCITVKVPEINVEKPRWPIK